MTWAQIKAELDCPTSTKDAFKKLLQRGDFWNSDPRTILRAAFYLHRTERSVESLRVIEAASLQGIPFSRANKMALQYLKGDALHTLRDFKKAISVYGEILEKESTDVAFANRALAHWELRDYGEALNDYCEALKLNPSNTLALRGAGEMLNKLNRPVEAIPYLTAAIKLNPEYTAAFTALGVSYFNSEDWLKSYQTLKKAVELDPDNQIALRGIAKIERHFELQN